MAPPSQGVCIIENKVIEWSVRYLRRYVNIGKRHLPRGAINIRKKIMAMLVDYIDEKQQTASGAHWLCIYTSIVLLRRKKNKVKLNN
jgi:hypothetical protein